MWACFYNLEHFATFEEAKATGGDRFVEVTRSMYLDTLVYRQRMAIVIETYLTDANSRAQETGKEVFCPMVGLGLGVWQISDKQNQIYVDCVYAAIRNLNVRGIHGVDG